MIPRSNARRRISRQARAAPRRRSSARARARRPGGAGRCDQCAGTASGRTAPEPRRTARASQALDARAADDALGPSAIRTTPCPCRRSRATRRRASRLHRRREPHRRSRRGAEPVAQERVLVALAPDRRLLGVSRAGRASRRGAPCSVSTDRGSSARVAAADRVLEEQVAREARGRPRRSDVSSEWPGVGIDSTPHSAACTPLDPEPALELAVARRCGRGARASSGAR